MERETLQEFKRRSRFPADRKKEYNIRNSWGVYDFYKYYRKTKPKDPKFIISDVQYYAIFRRVNELLVDSLVRTGELEFPYKMGKLIVFKKTLKSWIAPNGERYTSRKVNWDKTLELWYNDEEAYRNKTLLYFEDDERLTIRYNKTKAEFKNKYYYEFKPSRDIDRRVKNESVVSLIINREMSKQINGLYDG
jgi:hypothetical protein